MRPNSIWHPFSFEGASLLKKKLKSGIRIVIKTLTSLFPMTVSDATAANVVSLNVNGNTKRTITIDGVEYDVPDGYTPLKSFTFNGSGYITTPLTSFKNTYTYKIGVKRISTTTKFLFGENPDYSTNNIGMYDYNYGYYIQNGAGTRTAVAVNTTDYHDIIIEDDGYTVDGTKTSVTAVSEFTVSKTLIIGGGWNSTIVDSRMSTDEFEYFIVLDENGDEIFVGQPMKNSSSVVGLYDFASGTFLTPSSGSFTAGNELPTSECPLIYKSVGDKTENLLNPSNIHQGTIRGSDGQVVSASNRCYWDYIPVKSGDIIWFSAKNDTPPPYVNVMLYSDTSEASFISQMLGTAFAFGEYTGYYYTATADGYARGLFLQAANFTPSDVVEAQVVIQTTAPSSYIPYGYAFPLLKAENCGMIRLKDMSFSKTTNTHGIVYWDSGSLNGLVYVNASTNKYYLKGYTFGLYAYNNATTYDMTMSTKSNGINFCVVPDKEYDTASDFIASLPDDLYLYYQRTTDSSWTTPTTTNCYVEEPIREVYSGGKVDMGDLTWALGGTIGSGHERWYSTSLNGTVYNNSTSTVANAYCSKYKTTSNDAIYAHTDDKAFGLMNSDECLSIYDSDMMSLTADEFKESLKGVYLYYQTTSQSYWTQPYIDTLKSGDNKTHRNVGSIEFDGTETWTYDSTSLRFYTDLSLAKKPTQGSKTLPAYCTHYVMLCNGESSPTSGQGYIGVTTSSNPACVYLYDTDKTSLSNWTTWLAAEKTAGTPVTLYFILDSETEESITCPTLTNGVGLNYMECETDVKPSNQTVVYRKR